MKPHALNTKSSDTKSHILNVGYQLIAQKGFTAVGLKQILDTAGIPKGSFYHYFASKEAFGEELITHYFHHYRHRLDALSEHNTTAQQKIYEYFHFWYETQQCNHVENKCLLVKLSGEVADISEPMRQALANGYQLILAWLSNQIKMGWADGSVPNIANLSAESIANRWYYTWLGASLMTKISQSNIHLTEAWQMTLTELGR